jgi:hypothetical protein
LIEALFLEEKSSTGEATTIDPALRRFYFYADRSGRDGKRRVMTSSGRSNKETSRHFLLHFGKDSDI